MGRKDTSDRGPEKTPSGPGFRERQDISSTSEASGTATGTRIDLESIAAQGAMNCLLNARVDALSVGLSLPSRGSQASMASCITLAATACRKLRAFIRSTGVAVSLFVRAIITGRLDL